MALRSSLKEFSITRRTSPRRVSKYVSYAVIIILGLICLMWGIQRRRATIITPVPLEPGIQLVPITPTPSAR